MSELSEEEKKVIEKTKNSLKLLENNKSCTNVFYDISNLRALVNLIEKLKKEINELEQINKEYIKVKDKGIFYTTESGFGMIVIDPKTVVEKSKIREKIKELEQELLEE